jgi:hypothetical protein
VHPGQGVEGGEGPGQPVGVEGGPGLGVQHRLGVGGELPGAVEGAQGGFVLAPGELEPGQEDQRLD